MNNYLLMKELFHGISQGVMPRLHTTDLNEIALSNIERWIHSLSVPLYAHHQSVEGQNVFFRIYRMMLDQTGAYVCRPYQFTHCCAIL